MAWQMEVSALTSYIITVHQQFCISYYVGGIQSYTSISECLIGYYHEKEVRTRIHQKSTDIRRIITTHLERSYKKLDIQEKQLIKYYLDNSDEAKVIIQNGFDIVADNYVWSNIVEQLIRNV